ncbi:Alpha/Beta hydrolase protein [Aspergillus recurvatus]
MSALSLLLAAIQVATITVCASGSSPFNLSSSGFRPLNFSSSCDAACQTAYTEGLAYDANLFVHLDVSLDPFYAPPANFSSYAVGDLVKWEDIDSAAVSTSYWVPAGLSLSRFFYVSEDVDGKPLPATGYVLFPYTNPLGYNKPYRVVVWAHGTSGFTPQCAPSNNKGLQYNWQAPFALAEQGYIVIAPDYAGLGTKIPAGFMYNAGVSHAADVSTAVQAVRKNFNPHDSLLTLTNEWMVIGHGEGGLTAWRTAEREAKADPRETKITRIPPVADFANTTTARAGAGAPAGGLIGAVAIAPAMELMSLVPPAITKAHGGPLQFFVPPMLRSIARLFPSLNLSKYMTRKLIDRTHLATSGLGCLNAAVPLLTNISLTDTYLHNTTFTSAPEVLAWEERYAGKGPAVLGGPMLVLHGRKDSIVPWLHVEEIVAAQCNAFPRSQVMYSVLQGLDHDGALAATHSIWLKWIHDRFEGRYVGHVCVKYDTWTDAKRFSTIEQVWESRGRMMLQ